VARGVAAYDRRMIQFVHSGPCAYGSSRPTETKPPRPPSAAWLEVVSAGSWDPSADGGDGHIWPLYCEDAVLILPSLVHHSWQCANRPDRVQQPEEQALGVGPVQVADGQHLRIGTPFPSSAYPRLGIHL
jgi:hypothetical protein